MSTEKSGFSLRGRNPDVLTCIANLSNDEVFTPSEFVNRMLDTEAQAWAAGHGGADIWAGPTVRFLDPRTKSGVFLREITTRLTQGLAGRMPDASLSYTGIGATTGCTTRWWRWSDVPACQPCDAGHRLQHRSG